MIRDLLEHLELLVEATVEELRAAFDNTPPDYAKSLMKTRNPGPKASGSTFVRKMTWEDVKGADWKPYRHPEVSAPAKAFKAPIPGYFGLLKLSKLDPKQMGKLSDPKGTGFVEFEVPGVRGKKVSFTVALMGPGEGGNVIWTFFPGDPIMPSRVEAKGVDGKKISVAEALDMGFVWGKVV